MDSENVIKLLKSNHKTVGSNTVRLLMKIAQNILSYPKEEKVRILRKDNHKVKREIVSIPGGVDCLKLMGFQEDDVTFILPVNVATKQLESVKERLAKLLISWNAETGTIPKEPKANVPTPLPSQEEDFQVRRFILPPFTPTFSNKFLSKIELYFHNALAFDDKETQLRAKAMVPLTELRIAAQRDLRVYQEALKRGKQPDSDICIIDMLLVQLLRWFKNEFFTWVDTLDCSHCGGATTMSHMSTDPADFVYTERVEVHKCVTCKKLTKFPRYNDLNILLETRRGRCGEWAQVFTLMCRALGWDARYVVDETDHVWTEVFGIVQRRWLHCDPCENVCDSPLMYESGWDKKITYVIAYSGEEVQDVTWRYTSRHKEVLASRRNCTELELINALIQLRAKRQQSLSDYRKRYLLLRLVQELAELMTERKPTDQESEGRVSGSLDWRVARGEIKEVKQKSETVWVMDDNQIINNKITIRYSVADDFYECVLNDEPNRRKRGWNEGSFSSLNMLRKEESDWKMVYLAREEDAETANITWKFRLDSTDKVIETITVKFVQTTYGTGKIDVTLKSDLNNSIVFLPKDQEVAVVSNFLGAKEVTIRATLTGGKGRVAWQHTQIFRQPLDSKEFPFEVTFKFKSITEINNPVTNV